MEEEKKREAADLSKSSVARHIAESDESEEEDEVNQEEELSAA